MCQVFAVNGWAPHLGRWWLEGVPARAVLRRNLAKFESTDGRPPPECDAPFPSKMPRLGTLSSAAVTSSAAAPLVAILLLLLRPHGAHSATVP